MQAKYNNVPVQKYVFDSILANDVVVINKMVQHVLLLTQQYAIALHT